MVNRNSNFHHQDLHQLWHREASYDAPARQTRGCPPVVPALIYRIRRRCSIRYLDGMFLFIVFPHCDGNGDTCRDEGTGYSSLGSFKPFCTQPLNFRHAQQCPPWLTLDINTIYLGQILFTDAGTGNRDRSPHSLHYDHLYSHDNRRRLSHRSHPLRSHKFRKLSQRLRHASGNIQIGDSDHERGLLHRVLPRTQLYLFPDCQSLRPGDPVSLPDRHRRGHVRATDAQWSSDPCGAER